MSNRLLSNFLGGEVSPRIWSRPDVQKVASGCRTIENGIVLVHGGIYKRSGTKYVVNTKDTSRHELVNFQYSDEASYRLLFGNGYIWVMKDQGVVTHTAETITNISQAANAVVSIAGHGFSNGDWVYITDVAGMTSVNNRAYEVINVTTNSFELSGCDTTGFSAYTSGGSCAKMVEIETSYTTAQLPDLRFTQINNYLYIVHPAHPPARLTRSSDTAWSLGNIDTSTGPWDSFNTDEDVTMTMSSFSASAHSTWGTHAEGETFTMTCSEALFTENMVGTHFRLWEEGDDTGVSNPPVGDADVTWFPDFPCYTLDGKVYGMSNDNTGKTTWNHITRVPAQSFGTVRVYIHDNSAVLYFDSTFLHPQYCIVQVTGYTSSTVVTCQIVKHYMPKSIVDGGTSYWQGSAWTADNGYPYAITFFESRLFFGGSTTSKTVIWSSKVGLFEDFTDGAEDNDAITYRIASGSSDVIRWLSGRRVLSAGTAGSEFYIGASSDQQKVTATNIKAVIQTDLGTAAVRNIGIDQSVLFGQKNGDPTNYPLRLREYQFQPRQDQFISTDLTIFAEHITGSGFVDIDFQRDQDPLIWLLRADGVLAACTYEKDQEVLSWHRHVISGTDAVVKCICVGPGASGDELWMQVNRTIDGETASYVEVLQPRHRELIDARNTSFMLDSGLQYSGSAVDEITGLYHLRGQTVKYLADGYVYSGTVSSLGVLELDESASVVTVGLPYTFVAETTELEAGRPGDSSLAQPTHIDQMWIRVLDSYGGSVGPDSSTLEPLLYRNGTQSIGAAGDMFTGYIPVDFPEGYEREIIIRIEQDDPLPFLVTTILSSEDMARGR